MASVIPGLSVGHVTDNRGLTGCTVIMPEGPATGALEIAGRAAAVHGLEFLDPRHLAPTVDAIVLAGGSAYGLEAIWGVMQWLDERGRGFPVSRTVVPHVAGAIIFDLSVGDHRARPDRAMGHAAAAAAGAGPVAEGSVGAGTGATVGKLYGIERAMRGGLGVARVDRDGITTAALMVVNAAGDVRDPATGRLLAGARDAPDGRQLVDTAAALAAGVSPPRFRPAHTTIGVVATNARLTKDQANRMALMANDGCARAIVPSHTLGDGDTIFALATGRWSGDVDVTTIGALAAEAMADAIVRAATRATSVAGITAARDLKK